MGNAIVSFPVGTVVPPQCSRHHAEVVSGSFLPGGQDGAHAGGIDGAWLLQKAVLLGVNRGVEMRGPEMRRRGEQHHVHVGFQHLLISVEANKTMVVGNLHLRLCWRDSGGRWPLIRKDIAQRHDLEIGSRLEKVQRGARASVSTANQSGLQDGAVRGCIDEGHRRIGLLATGQNRSGAYGGNGSNKCPAVKIAFFLVVLFVNHGGYPWNREFIDHFKSVAQGPLSGPAALELRFLDFAARAA